MRLKSKYMIRKQGKFFKSIQMHKSKYCEAPSPVAVSDYMSGKMTNIPSISTSCVVNPICQARMKDPTSICAECFANGVVKRYSELGKNLESNYYLLTTSVLPESELPRFKESVQVVRIESFGDVANVTQAINYINICKANPHVVFAWWSKNTKIINAAFDLVGKPRNVIMVESSEKLNVQKELSANFDKVFTVYDEAHIVGQNIDINCGARSCDTCRRCYSHDTAVVVKERLKGAKAA